MMEEKKKKSKSSSKPVYFYPVLGAVFVLAVALAIVVYIQLQNEKKVAEKPEPVKILMLGNDLFTNNDIPDMVRQLFEQAKIKNGVVIESIALPDRNYHLAQHLKSKSLQKIVDRKLKWDFLVLQESPEYLLDHPYEVLKDVRKLREKFQNGSPRIVLITPWVAESERVKQEVLNAVVSKMAKNLSVRMVPIGDLLFALREDYPELKVFMGDSNQTSADGAWIASASIYSVISGKAPRVSSNSPSYKIGEKAKPHISLSLDKQAAIADMAFKAASKANRGYSLGLQRQKKNPHSLTPRFQ